MIMPYKFIRRVGADCLVGWHFRITQQ